MLDILSEFVAGDGDNKSLNVQIVEIELADGRKSRFFGAPMVAPFEVAAIEVKQVNFSEFIELPIGELEIESIAGAIAPALSDDSDKMH